MPPTAHKSFRIPAQNIAKPVQFILRGSEKRRNLAIHKAQQLQRDLGVLPHQGVRLV